MTPWEDDITEGLKAARDAKLLDEVRKEARNKVLDEAIEKIKVKGLGEDDYNGKIIFEILNSLKV